MAQQHSINIIVGIFSTDRDTHFNCRLGHLNIFAVRAFEFCGIKSEMTQHYRASTLTMLVILLLVENSAIYILEIFSI